MEPLLIAGLVHFNDSFAADARSGLGCSAAPCEVVLPAEGRVLAFESDAAIDGIAFSGGPLTVHCITDGDSYGSEPIPSVDIRDASGDIHITGCGVAECARVSGTLRAEWTNDAICTDFSGTFVSLGDSRSSVSGTGTLQSGGSGLTTLVGPAWTITGTGPVNFNLVDDFSFSGGTAGIEVADWAWLQRPTVTIWEFASAAPMQEFVDQTIEVIGGWPEGSTLNGCTVSGTLGHVPRITASKVYVAEHAYGPIVSVIEDSEIFGDVRAEGRVFLNNVHGDISVASETTFVNTFSGTGELLVDGPHTVMCPTCERVRLYDDSITTVETDLLIETEPTHAIDLNGHTALLGNLAPSRARRDFIDSNGVNTTIYPKFALSSGNVTLTEDIKLPFDATFIGVAFDFNGYSIELESTGSAYSPGSLDFLRSTSVSAGTFSTPSRITMNNETSFAFDSSSLSGFLELRVPPAATAGLVAVSVVSTADVGAISFNVEGAIDLLVVCYLTVEDQPQYTANYVYNSHSSANVNTNGGDPVCFYAGNGNDATADNNTCTSPGFVALGLGSSGNFCYGLTTTTTTTTITTTTIATTTTTATPTTSTAITPPATTAPPTTTAPRAASSSSSSSLSDTDIAGIVAGAVIATVLLVAGVVFAMRRGGSGLVARDYGGGGSTTFRNPGFSGGHSYESV